MIGRFGCKPRAYTLAADLRTRSPLKLADFDSGLRRAPFNIVAHQLINNAAVSNMFECFNDVRK